MRFSPLSFSLCLGLLLPIWSLMGQSGQILQKDIQMSLGNGLRFFEYENNMHLHIVSFCAYFPLKNMSRKLRNSELHCMWHQEG